MRSVGPEPEMRSTTGHGADVPGHRTDPAINPAGVEMWTVSELHWRLCGAVEACAAAASKADVAREVINPSVVKIRARMRIRR